MRNKNSLFNRDSRMLQAFSDLSQKCKHCGHTVHFYSFEKEKKICNWCKNYIYKDEKIEFLEKMKKALKK